MTAGERRATVPAWDREIGVSTTARGAVPSISVVIPVYNGGQSFRACLRSLSALTPPAHEMIVVDDGSTDGSARDASDAGAKVLATPSQRGPAYARNLGAQQAEGEVLLFLDADVSAPPDIIGQVGAAFASEPGLSALFGSYDAAPAATDFPSQYKNLLHHYVHQTSQEEAFTFWTGCGAIRREVFLAVGGFDEARYRAPSVEDIELGYRLAHAGHRVRLLKHIQVKHLKQWKRWELVRCDFAQRALPWSRLILHHRRLANDLNIGWSSRVSVLAAGGLAASIAGAFWRPQFLALAGGFAIMLIAPNWPLYRFFAQARGTIFAARAMPWHWLYFLYSGLAFCLALGEHLFKGVFRLNGSIGRGPRDLDSRKESRQTESRGTP
jgi:glycosyltransferase involved in cell wall biosynthesis